MFHVCASFYIIFKLFRDSTTDWNKKLTLFCGFLTNSIICIQLNFSQQLITIVPNTFSFFKLD